MRVRVRLPGPHPAGVSKWSASLFAPVMGNTIPGVDASVSRALAVGIAEQAASRSNAAGRSHR